MHRSLLALTSATLLTGFAGFAAAADIPARRSYSAPAMVAPVYNWTGFYAGLNAGYGWGRQTTTFGGIAAGSISERADGFIGGGQIGYNWQTPANWVFGVEADIQGSGMKRTTGSVV